MVRLGRSIGLPLVSNPVIRYSRKAFDDIEDYEDKVSPLERQDRQHMATVIENLAAKDIEPNADTYNELISMLMKWDD